MEPEAQATHLDAIAAIHVSEAAASEQHTGMMGSRLHSLGSLTAGAKGSAFREVQAEDGLRPEKSGSSAVSQLSSVAGATRDAQIAGIRSTKRSLTSKAGSMGVTRLFGSRRSVG